MQYEALLVLDMGEYEHLSSAKDGVTFLQLSVLGSDKGGGNNPKGMGRPAKVRLHGGRRSYFPAKVRLTHQLGGGTCPPLPLALAPWA